MGDAESEHFVEAASIFLKQKRIEIRFDVCYINEDSNEKSKC